MLNEFSLVKTLAEVPDFGMANPCCEMHEVQLVIALPEFSMACTAIKSDFIQSPETDQNSLNKYVCSLAGLVLSHYLELRELEDHFEMEGHYLEFLMRMHEYFEDLTQDIRSSYLWRGFEMNPTIQLLYLEPLDFYGNAVLYALVRT